jgi:hypothetical protein
VRTSRKKSPHFDEESDYYSDYKEKSKRRPRYARQEVFKCRHCRQFIGPLPSGGTQRNHCPYCLYSRHVDGSTTGDRMSTCGASMQPVGSFQRAKGEFVIVHRCLDCGFERFNRIAADDDFDLVLSLPAVPARTSREMKQLRLLEECESDNPNTSRSAS